MRSTALRHILPVVTLVALAAVGCSTPVIPEVVAPATPTPVPEPTPTPAPTVQNQPTPTPAPFESEPGVTATEIRIGVIIDVGGDPVSDQMSRSAAEAVEAWAAAVNAESELARRTVVVERIPTSPVLANHAEAIDLACNRDFFALVGSVALFDSLGLDQLEDPACGLPDFPAVASSVERLESSVTTLSNPINANTWSAGWARHYAETLPELVAAAATMPLDFPVSVVSGERMIEAAETQGYQFVHRPQITFDTDFVDEAAALAQSGAAMLTWRNDGGRLLTLLGELDAQNVSVAIDCGQACYSRAWVEEAGDLAEGVSVWLPTHPLEEADRVSELTRYLFWLGSTHPQAAPTAFGVAAWSAALLFEESVNLAIGAGTAEYDPSTLTRAGVLDAAATIDAWDARGLQGTANPAAGVPSPCFVRLTLVDGTWERTFPERRGEFDCAPENLVELTITSTLGTSQPTPTPDEAAAEEPADG